MAENEGGRSGGAAAAAAPKADHPLRPTIALPPRSSYESLFRGGGVGASDVSPGPMTLVSSFFAEDPDSDCRSFSQLLAGALASPATVPSRTPISFTAEEKTDSGGGGGGGGGGESGVLRQNRPLGLLAVPSPFFTVPPGLSPATLLESPGAFFSSGSGHFGMSHQQALAQVTALAAQAHSHQHIQVDRPSLPAGTTAALTQPTSSSSNTTHIQQMALQTSETNNSTLESAEDSHCDRRSQSTGIIVDKPADDGYNWRKYGQKQVKGSEYPRSYYKCTHQSCPVKKKVEHSFDGHISEIIYKGQHSHQRPAPSRRSKECGALLSGLNELNGSLDFPAGSEKVAQSDPGNFNRSSDTLVVPSISKRDRESGNGTSEQLSESSDGEEVGDTELRTKEGDDNVPDPKRRKTDTRVIESTSSHRIVSEPRIIVQTTSEVDLLDDGYRWRKYGQKVVKGNPYPRSYYKCTSMGCTVRKHVERASTDPKAVITTYEGKHNHEVPKARNSNGVGGCVSNSIQPKVQNTIHNNNQRFLKRADLRNGARQPVTLQMKEEHEIV